MLELVMLTAFAVLRTKTDELTQPVNGSLFWWFAAYRCLGSLCHQHAGHPGDGFRSQPIG